MNRILFWLKISRLFSLPMTVLSWAVIFTYALSFNGNITNGILALFGIAFAHLSTNVFDDYIDYRTLDCKNVQQCKCEYIRNGEISQNEVLFVAIIYLFIASIFGLVLFLKTGFPVIYLAIIGALIAISYAFLSQKGFSEFAVGIAFGPLLFEGVFYVMTKTFSFEVLILSLAVVFFTIGLMYSHTVLDYEGDVATHKKTLCSKFSKKNAIKGVWVVYGLGYIFTTIFAIISKNYFIFLTLLLIPLVFNLYNSLKTFTCGNEVKEFYFRLLKARNLMVFYSIIVIICLPIQFMLL